ncbi:hypothetical protein [Actinophytocola glycyrrhizae]|uniref:Lipoprotein n=1 Tax=Actinophytocola glycyrrhizae TaxID=2044873 RepID=A0ABV9S2B0_9PSEU
MFTRSRPRIAALAAALALLTAGCAEEPPVLDIPPSTEPPPEVTTSQSGAPAPENEVVRTTGEVVAGVEPGCLLLDNGEIRYLLLGGDRDRLEPGHRLTVTGVADPGTPTTCMEGIPLRVTELGPAG